MRNVGPILVILFSVLILGAMFLPYAETFNDDSNFWVLTSGADIALALACVLALGSAIGALLVKAGPLRTLAAVFGGLACGILWAFSANVLSDTEGTKFGFWLLSVLGIFILISAIAVALGPPSEAAPAASASPGRAPAPAPAPAPARPAPAPARPAPAPAPAQQPGAHPAGWYPDPSGGGAQRYWDGTRWTDQFRG